MSRVAVALLMLALLLAACSDPRPDPRPTPTPSARQNCDDDGGGDSGGVDDTSRLTIGDKSWSFGVHRPAGHEGERLPVVYLLHGLGNEAEQNLLYTGFAAAADEHGFVVVSPQARGERKSWDVMTPRSTRGSDLYFLDRLMRQVPDRWCGDRDRQDVAGISNGSAMAFAMACDGDFPIRAYGAVAAAFFEPAACRRSPPASIVYFHGTSDPVVPFGGGPTPLFPVEAAPVSLARWGQHDGCASSSDRSIGDDVTVKTWRGCEDGARLQAYTIAGGGHTWPGAAVEIPSLGATTRTIDATDLMVSFFGLD